MFENITLYLLEVLVQKLMDKSIMELAPLIQAKQLSPLDLVKECLRRIEDTEPLINAYLPFCARRRS
jgi:Asp-tRNA(Asn)/Glu-tRNA(Gln) amidotransferase A subunit family amidase